MNVCVIRVLEPFKLHGYSIIAHWRVLALDPDVCLSDMAFGVTTKQNNRGISAMHGVESVLSLK